MDMCISAYTQQHKQRKQRPFSGLLPFVLSDETMCGIMCARAKATKTKERGKTHEHEEDPSV